MLKRRSWLGLALALPLVPGLVHAQNNVVVFAAASLKNALDEIAATWSKDTGKPVPRISYAASSALAKQMEQGAPADMFISADLDWMDYVQAKNLIKADTRFNLLGNKIVVIAPRDSKTSSRATISPRRWPAVVCRWPTSTPCQRASTARPRWRSSAPGTR
jgi:molybdate transport system substrate-binding protein